MEKKQNVPALRFPGFSGEWKRSLLKEVTKRVIVGLATSVTPYYRTSGTPILRNLNIKENYLDDRDILFLDKDYAARQTGKQIHTGDVLTVHTGYIGTSCIVPQKYDGCLTFTTLITTTNDEELRGEFLSQYLNTPMGLQNVQMVTTQGGRQNLNTGDFVQVKVPYPSLKEQIQLEKFLRGIDQVIWKRQHKIQKLQQFRQAMLAKLFPREGAAEPELRFRGFSGKWKLRRLSDFVKEVTRVDASSHAPIMMITAANGFINQSERYSFDNSGQSLQKYILLKQGELAYNHGASKLRPFGSCFVLREKEARVPFVYHCFSVTDNYADFVALELNGNLVERQLRRIVSSGARMDGLLNISFEEYCTVEIALPCQEEQRKIGSFFRELDDFISLQQKKLERMQRLKAALLEKLFV